MIRSFVRLFNRLTRLEARRQRRRERRRRRSRRIAEQLAARYGMRVQQGPFAGMVYSSAEAASSELVPKLLGSYEKELHSIIERVCERAYDRVINIGSGEGYYAVGMARRMPEAHVYAFDIDAQARQECRTMARANEVANRVFVEGACDHTRLRELTQTPALVISDCEGAELELLRPDLVPSLVHCDLLVELHAVPGVESTRREILARFTASHDAELRQYHPRDPKAYPALRFLSHRDRKHAVDEFRSHGLEWVLLERKR